MVNNIAHSSRLVRISPAIIIADNASMTVNPGIELPPPLPDPVVLTTKQLVETLEIDVVASVNSTLTQ